MMRKRYAIMMFLLLGWVPFALADSSLSSLNQNASALFSATTYDLSLSYLRMLFGSVGNQLVGVSSGLTGQIFKIFNLGMLVFAGSFVSYTVFTSVLGTASDGSRGMGGSVSGWVPFRIVTGVSMLVPQFGGYSMVQVIVMWAVVQGVGLADHIWAKALLYIKDTGGAMLTTAPDSAMNDLRFLVNGNNTNTEYFTRAPTTTATGKTAYMLDVMTAAYCLAALEQSDIDAGKSGSYTYGVYQNTSSETKCSTAGNRVCFGRKRVSGTINTSSNTSICGEFSWTSASSWTSDSGNFSMSESAQGNSSMGQLVDGAVLNLATTAYALAQSSFSNFYNQVSGSNSTSTSMLRCDVSDSTAAANCAPGTDISSLATTFFDGLQPARTLITDDSPDTTWMDAALKGGWVAAAYNYYNLVGQGNSAVPTLQDISDISMSVTAQSSNTGMSGVAKTTYNAITNAMGTFGVAANQQISNIFSSTLSGAGSSATDLSSVLSTTGSSSDSTGDLPSNVAYQNIQPALDDVTARFLTLLVFSRSTLADQFSSTVFNQSSLTFGNRTDLVTDNILNMMIRIISAMMGIAPYAVPLDGIPNSGYNYGMDDPYIADNGATLDTLLPMANPACMLSNAVCVPGASTDCFATNYMLSKQSLSDSSISPCLVPGQGLLGGMVSNIAGQQVDPLLLLSSLGLTMLQEAINYWTYTIQGVYQLGVDLLWRYQAVMMTTGAIGGVTAGLFGLIPYNFGAPFTALFSWLTQTTMMVFKMLFQFDMTSMTIYLPFGAAIALMFFTLGVLLGVYLPFVPFMVFTFSVIGWMISVIEAMVAAPLVALGVTHPEGHDLLGKAEQSVILLLGIFVRPAALLIGFILSIILLHVSMDMLNYGFMNVFSQYLSSNSFTGSNVMMVKLVGMVGVLIIYAYVAWDVVDMAVSLIYKVPENLNRWIGGQPEQFGIGAMMQEVKGGVTQAAGTTGQAASSSASQAPQVGSPADVTAKLNLKPQKDNKDADIGNEPPGGGGDNPPSSAS